MTDIRSLTLGELETECRELGEKPFRARQVYEWLHKKQVLAYDEMTNIPKNLREKLEKNLSWFRLRWRMSGFLRSTVHENTCWDLRMAM